MLGGQRVRIDVTKSAQEETEIEAEAQAEGPTEAQ